MRTLNLTVGTDILRAAEMLVLSAPAYAEFNGVPIRARYATTRPRDIVAHFRRLCDKHSAAYQNSPEGKREAEESRLDIVAKQATVDRLCAGLPNFQLPGDVLAWIEEIAPAADRIGVVCDRSKLTLQFAIGKYYSNANCDDHFNGDDPINFARWIVGQWLSSGNSKIVMYIRHWRERFEKITA
jgi:hypothetical protein